MKTRTVRFLLTALILILALTACLPGKAVKGADQEAVLVYAEPIADHILTGIETNDYALFSQDFGEQLLASITESSFQDLRTMLSDKIGSYQSRQVSSVRDTDGNMVVIYTAVFSNAKQVVITLSVAKEEPHTVNGLWLDSPELRK